MAWPSLASSLEGRSEKNVAGKFIFNPIIRRFRVGPPETGNLDSPVACYRMVCKVGFPLIKMVRFSHGLIRDGVVVFLHSQLQLELFRQMLVSWLQVIVVISSSGLGEVSFSWQQKWNCLGKLIAFHRISGQFALSAVFW